MYGLSRLGKTTIIRRLLSADAPAPEASTPDYGVYRGRLRRRLEEERDCPVAIADYYGQQPSQIVVNAPAAFFGSAGHRLINAVFFVVDLFPEFASSEGDGLHGVGTAGALDQYATDAEARIRARVAEHREYITRFSIEPVLSAAFSREHLFAVRLLINKLDLLRQVVARGYLPDLTENALFEYAQRHYEPVETALRRACSQNGIADLSVHLVSGASGEHVTEVISGVLETYSRRAEKQ